MGSYAEDLAAIVERLQSTYDTSHSSALDSDDNVYKVDHLGPDVTYDEFFQQYAVANKPCVLSSHHTSDWKCREWVDSTGRPRFELLKSLFGSSTVPVSDCSVRRYDSPGCCDMVFSEYANYWQKLVESGHDYTTNPCLYLKDWHFTRDFPTYGAYTTPKHFTSDWLNEFWDTRTDITDDFRFVYMGPKGSWTPLHTDVFKSFSWSANICGKKLWYLFPPHKGQGTKGERNLLPYDIDTLYEQSMQDAAMAQNLPEPVHNPLYLTVIQNPGEIIFIPSHWYHQVHNLDDTISINHNFFNACNVRTVMINLMAALIDVQEEISAFGDTEGFHEHCQAMLRAHFGMNMADFCKMLEAVLTHRIDMLEVSAVQRSVAYFRREAVISDIVVALSCHKEVLSLPTPILEAASITNDLICCLRKKLELLGQHDKNLEHALSLDAPPMAVSL